MPARNPALSGWPKLTGGLPHQLDKPPHHRRRLVASVRQVERRFRLRLARELAEDDAIHAQMLQRGGHQRDAEPGRHQAERRQDARRLLADERAEAGAVAGRDDRVVKPGADRAAVEDEGLAGQRRQLQRRVVA
jgi:hypothetical protein